jgi:cell division protein FtsL
MTVAVVIFTLGVATIAGDNKVYSMQNSVTSLNTQIKQAQEENEALKVELLKFSSLNNIEKKAEGNLSMFVPKKGEVVKIDFSQDYFSDLKSNSSAENTKESNIFSKLKILFK